MARKSIGLRISATADDTIRALADEYGVPYTVVIRACLAIAFAHEAELKRTLAAAGKTQ